MNAARLIERKRDGLRLSGPEIGWLISEFTAGRVPDYQMAAWLMAVRLRGMDRAETLALTKAMMGSGRIYDLADVAGPKVDKHSTGGVGDKVSLVLAPLAAACGVVVPMVSGRSLGHTGGTLDKLESIPGFRTDLTYDEFRRVLRKTGLAMGGQTAEMCPADRRMYALRDATGTVDSVPLIAASIMSKKLAEGIDGLVLDVKTGAGAFMKRPSDARRLAREMLALASGMGCRATAIVTGMWQPLGMAVGNSIEVAESIECLRGSCPADLQEVTYGLGVEMLLLAGRARTRREALELLVGAVHSGAALGRFRTVVAAQGGDPNVVDDYRRLPHAQYRAAVRAPRAGFVASIEALEVGRLGIELGIGRASVGSAVDHAAGFLFRRKVGDEVEPGEILAEVLGSSRRRVRQAAEGLPDCISVRGSRTKPPPLMLGRVAPGSRRRRPGATV